ncbi:hypothetical protein GUJ93_ZPchr0005g16330 [Zizania palustris]|uniref:Uncharacterized protein n=1 Tax=Zizania palustris TaxID=103762 RepID=A0A8J5ST09_ZIZPA|nr:hypothetical protein GUJ93_ZPchr0005g16330 [Zizania palustris]
MQPDSMRLRVYFNTHAKNPKCTFRIEVEKIIREKQGIYLFKSFLGDPGIFQKTLSSIPFQPYLTTFHQLSTSPSTHIPSPCFARRARLPLPIFPLGSTIDHSLLHIKPIPHPYSMKYFDFSNTHRFIANH